MRVNWFAVNCLIGKVVDDMGEANIGVTGLAVMGRNLARNLARHGYRVAVHNRSQAKTDALVADYQNEGTFIPSSSMEEFVESLERPRIAIVMVQAGFATDAVIDQLCPLMEPGDIIVDAGNAYFPDTIRRERKLSEMGIHFVGTGVSGGEEGALLGPSIMPGGSKDSYEVLGPILEQISAHVGGVPCCTHVGPNGAGHFVKMVHNGIEYADMQLIAEAYDLLKSGLGVSSAELADVFAKWNTGELESYLIEITAKVLGHTLPDSDESIVDVIVDEASQKGTGKWTVQNALDLGVPVTGIAEATFARALSSSLPQRESAREHLQGKAQEWQIADADAFIEDVRQALYASKIVAYSQGFDQIAAASDAYDWDIDRGAMARIWRGGCIIRARFLDRITEAYERDPNLPLLLSDPYFTQAVTEGLEAWRRVVSQATRCGVPVPAFASCLSYYDGVRAPRLPANLIQAQRDFFGAHTYQRTDKPGTFHTEWSLDGSESAL